MGSPGSLSIRQGVQGVDLPTPSATPVKMFKVLGEGYLIGYGTAVPADGATGWAAGALFFLLDGSTAGANALFKNIGSDTSADFDQIEAT